VEIPFVEQLKGMDWDHIEGDIDVPYLTERESFRDVLLTGRLRDAIKKINLDDGGKPCIQATRIYIAIILDGLAEGLTPEQLLDHYPQLTLDDIHAALAYG